MELSLFLAKLLGIYLVIVAALWAARGEAVSKSVAELLASRATLFLSGLITLAAGISMAIAHSVWEFSWRGLITLFGYLSIAKGITRLAFPEISAKGANDLVKSDRARWPLIGLALVLGVYLTWIGFTGD